MELKFRLVKDDPPPHNDNNQILLVGNPDYVVLRWATDDLFTYGGWNAMCLKPNDLWAPLPDPQLIRDPTTQPKQNLPDGSDA